MKIKILLIAVIFGVLMPVYFAKAQEFWQQIYPECIQRQMNKDWDGNTAGCDDVGVFVELAINIGALMFTFVGALALLVFVYGGFKMIISAGDSGKIKEGKDAMIAAVIGIVIAFSGVAIVKFLGDSLQLKDEYKIDQITQSTDKEVCCKIPQEKQINESQINESDVSEELLNYVYKFTTKNQCPLNAEILESIKNKADCEKFN